MCKAIFLGGVTRRFPDLNFGFLEGGVGFACLLLADLMGHWNIRNGEALAYTDPANLDMGLLRELAEKYASVSFSDAIAKGRGIGTNNGSDTTGGVGDLDDYAACGIRDKEDFLDLFVKPFFFGCEADDPANAWAFNREFNPGNAEMKAMFGSDIGHFDVQDMTDVLPEAYELVEEGKIDRDQFKHFVLTTRFASGAKPIPISLPAPAWRKPRNRFLRAIEGSLSRSHPLTRVARARIGSFAVDDQGTA